MKRNISLALLLGLFIGVPVGSGLTNLFDDVSNVNSWYYDAVYSMKDKQIMTGYPDNTFQPNQNVTRAELAVVIDNLLDYSNNKSYIGIQKSDLIISEQLPDFVKPDSNIVFSSQKHKASFTQDVLYLPFVHAGGCSYDMTLYWDKTIQENNTITLFPDIQETSGLTSCTEQYGESTARFNLSDLKDYFPEQDKITINVGPYTLEYKF